MEETTNENVNENAQVQDVENENVNAQVQEVENESASAQEVENESASAQEVENEKPEIIKGIVTKVMIPQGTDERITFVLNKMFTTIDFSTGEEKETNMFGLNIFAVVNQVAQYVPEIQLADTLAMGKCVNPQIIALALTNSEIVVKREQHEQGEQRKNSNGLYARDCITSEITSVKTNIKPIFAQMLMQLVTSAPAIVKAASIPNPFGM